MTLLRLASVSIAIIFAFQVSAAQELTPHTAKYKVKISIVSGQLNTELRKTADGYVAHHVLKPTGLSRLIVHGRMEVTAEFSSSKESVKPIRFHSTDTIQDAPDVDLRFDWTSNKATGTVGADEISVQLDQIAYDSVSIQYALMHDLLNGGPNDHYVLFDVEKTRIAAVSIAGEKEIKTKAGKYTTIGIRHQKEGSSRITTLWCAKELGYLPLVIEQHKKGKLKFRARLVKYTPSSESIPEVSSIA